jgi:DNA polymerase-3 subunit alpha
MVIFGQTLEECGAAIEQDLIVLVKGRVDHKDKTRTCVVVQSVERFEPSREELEKAEAKAQEEAAKGVANSLRLRLDAAALPATAIDELRDLLISFPGESEVVIELSTRRGPRLLRLGVDYRVERGPGLHAELEDLLGSAILAPAAGGDGLIAGAAA